ncbi:MAG: hypothetical protein NT170_03140 [Candidatus Moranbacteria bacterium]|nr:hypothetical protein [Candidatus Moranbacteria bacterium]
MTKKSIFQEIRLDNLILDKSNPRFAELYDGSDKEEDLVEYLLFTESGEDIAKGISQADEYYPDRPLWVLEYGENYLVKDGNRRCAAVKALQFPKKYGLDLPKFSLIKLPVLIYKNKGDLEKRIIQEHTSSLFRQWDRIAKALEVYKLFTSGNSIDSMKDIDSSPSELIKLASFYYEAVKINGDDLKKLLRRGRGETGGKTIIFERLFKYKDLCGYKFKNKPSYKIDIFDQDKFSKYVSSVIEYLKKHPSTTHKTIDSEGKAFFEKLKEFGFDINEKREEKKRKATNSILPTDKKRRKSIKNKPIYERKGIPAPLEKLIKECYNLDSNNFSNAKTALTRVSFECTLKFVVENTEYKKGKKLSSLQVFRYAFFNKKGEKRALTDFTILKNGFTNLIMDVGKKNAFRDFDLDRSNQIIHNYNIGAVPSDAIAICDNLIVLLEFMLQDKRDLIASLNLTKI